MRIVTATMKSRVSQIDVKIFQVEGNCQSDVMGMELLSRHSLTKLRFQCYLCKIVISYEDLMPKRVFTNRRDTIGEYFSMR